MDTLPAAFSNPLPSLHLFDLFIGLCCGAGMRLAVYLKGKNAKKYRHGMEYGSARWGTPKDIEPFMAPKFADNIILTKIKTQKPTGFEENLNQSNPIQTNPNQEVNTPLTPHGWAGRTRQRAASPDSLPALTEAIEAYTDDDGLRDALGAYVTMRQKIRKPLTGKGLRLSFRELDKLAGDDVAQKIAIVEQSVQRSWQGLFALKLDSGGVQQDNGDDLLARMEASRREAREAAMKRARENSPWGR